MNNRIKELRIYLGLTQQEFGNKVGVSQNAIAKYEKGIRTPLEPTVKAICTETKASYEWLKYGTGEMFEEKDSLMDLVDRILRTEDEATKELFKSFAKLNADDWKALASLIEKMTKK